MIKSIHIKNFQAHKDTKIEFSNGVNGIIGTNDAGKSSIGRALRWCIFNKPNGSGFTRRQKNKNDVTSVEIELENGFIKREIGDENLYIFTSKNGKRQEFESFKLGVPDEIQEILNISAINFQSQHDAPFLLSNTSGEVARYLNKIVNLDVIDRSLSNIASLIKNENKNLVTEKNRVHELKEDKNKLSWVDEAKTELDKLNKLNTEITNLEVKITSLENLLDTIDDIEQEINNIEKITVNEKKCTNLLNLNEDIKKYIIEYNSLIDIIESIENCDKKLNKINTIVKFENKVNDLLKLSNEIDNIYSNRDKLNLYKLNIKEYKKEFETADNDFNYWQKELTKKMPNVCPLCEQKINKGDNK